MPNGEFIEIIKLGPSYIYIIKDEKGNEVMQRKGDTPNRITEASAVGKEIKRLLDPKKEYTKSAIKDKFILAMQALQQYWEAKSLVEQKRNVMTEVDTEKIRLERVENGFKHLDELTRPILWTASTIDWFTAGERMNILLAWICFVGQVVLKEQISVILEGEGSQGKTHIQDTALELIPQEHVLNVKSATMAVVYAMADKDPWYFDGMIINMGDMGGQNDHEEADEFKNIMKELQSDGHVMRTKMVKGADGEPTPKEFHLYGHPIITYTNVPGHDYDDQEMSRSILQQPLPRKYHQTAFMIFKRLNKQKGTKSAKLIQEHRDMIPAIRDMVRALRKRLETVTIYNPYWSFMEEYLANSKYIFRDTDKYDAILRVITCINGYNRKIYDVDGQPTLFTTKEDIGFFLELLDQYHKSIVSNMSPGAMDLLNNLTEKADIWFGDDRGADEQYTFRKGLTISDYIEESSTSLSRTTLQRYFKELADVGYLKIIGNESREYLYDIGKDSVIDDMGKVNLSELDLKIMEFNYGSDIIATFEDGWIEDIHLWDMHPDVDAPMWNKYLSKKM